MVEKLHDERQQQEFDFTQKQSVDHTEIIGFDGYRKALWNHIGLAERLKVQAYIVNGVGNGVGIYAT